MKTIRVVCAVTAVLAPAFAVGSFLGCGGGSGRSKPFGGAESAAAPLEGLRGRARLRLGEDFAILEERRVFRAESSYGTGVRIGSTRDQPRGDEEFWQQALLDSLASIRPRRQERLQ